MSKTVNRIERTPAGVEAFCSFGYIGTFESDCQALAAIRNCESALEGVEVSE